MILKKENISQDINSKNVNTARNYFVEEID